MEFYKHFEILMQHLHVFSLYRLSFKQVLQVTSIMSHRSLFFSKISKILTQKLSGRPPYTSCLVLAQQEGATEVVGFFGSSLRGVADKQTLGAFRGKQLRKAYHPIQLNVISSSLPPYGCCAESIPLQSNLVLWVPFFCLNS